MQFTTQLGYAWYHFPFPSLVHRDHLALDVVDLVCELEAEVLEAK